MHRGQACTEPGFSWKISPEVPGRRERENAAIGVCVTRDDISFSRTGKARSSARALTPIRLPVHREAIDARSANLTRSQRTSSIATLTSFYSPRVTLNITRRSGSYDWMPLDETYQAYLSVALYARSRSTAGIAPSVNL